MKAVALVATVITLLWLVQPPGSVAALAPCTINWDGGGDSSSWHDPLNWDSNAVPGAGDDACIPDILGTTTVVFSSVSGTQSIASLQSDEAFSITGGSLPIAAASEINDDFTVSGAFTVVGGSGTLNVSGLTTFSGGTMSGTGTTNANGGLAISGAAEKTLSARTLNNTAVGTWTGTGNLKFTGFAIFNNSGTFDVQNNQTLPPAAGGGTIQAQILDVLGKLQDERGMAIILITHDLGIVAEMAHDVAIMYAGRIVEHAPVKSLFALRKHPYSQGLFKSLPTFQTRGVRLQSIWCQVPAASDFPEAFRFHLVFQRAMAICWRG